MRRENNYDLLRVISTIAVIAIHVSATWYTRVVADVVNYGMQVQLNYPMVVSFWNVISRFAVPCFLMLSGAFLLDNEKNRDYKSFYRKTFQKVGIPTLIFSMLYILYRIPTCFVGGAVKWAQLVKDVMIGEPMMHMWYLYMLIGVYALIPIVIRFKESVAEETFRAVSFVFLILAMVSCWTSRGVSLNWDVGRSFEYMSYLMTGYTIRKVASPNNVKAVLAMGIGIMLELCAACLVYYYMMRGIGYADLRFSIVTPDSPLIVAASVLIFYGFSCLKFKGSVAGMSDLTFYIYLIHAGVWDFISKIFRLFRGKDYLTGVDSRWGIPVGIMVVFLLSVLLSRCYLWLVQKIHIKRRMPSAPE